MKLGTYTLALAGSLFIANCYTQVGFAEPGRPAFNYYAFDSILAELAKDFPGKRIGFPKIGATNAGGDWPRILHSIETILAPHAVVTVVLKESA